MKKHFNRKRGDNIRNREVDKSRSVRIVKVNQTGSLTNYKIIVDQKLFTYKSKEEIADMIYDTIQNYKEKR